jgi:protein TonB
VWAIVGAVALHGAVASVLLALASPRSAAMDDPAVVIVVEQSAPAAAAEVPSPKLEDALPPSEPNEAMAGPDFSLPPPPPVPPPPSLEDALPPPETREALAIPDLAPPRAPKPVPPREEPRKVAAPPQQQIQPKRAEPKPAPAQAPAARPTGNVASAAPPTPAPPVSAPATAVGPTWNTQLAAWLAANRRYPEASRRKSEEGEVTVRFTVAPDGRVTEVALVKGSGWAALDASALGMLRGATLPAPGAEATRTVRVRFRLSD